MRAPAREQGGTFVSLLWAQVVGAPRLHPHEYGPITLEN
jgi:hypothetical protein